MTCYELKPGTAAPEIVSVTAGSTFTFGVDSNIGHPGPLNFYMAKAPSGKTAATFDGKGAVWFKIYHDGPKITSTKIDWPSQGVFSLAPPTRLLVPKSSTKHCTCHLQERRKSA